MAEATGALRPGVLLVVDDLLAQRTGRGRRAPWASRRRSSRGRRGGAPRPGARRTGRARRRARRGPARRRSRRPGSPRGRCAPRRGTPGPRRSPAGPRPRRYLTLRQVSQREPERVFFASSRPPVRNLAKRIVGGSAGRSVLAGGVGSWRWPTLGGVMSDRVPYLTSRLQGFGTTIFAEMSALAVRTGAINLGQGFPDTDGPPEVLDAAVDAIRERAQPVPAGPRRPRAARGDRRPPAALVRARPRPRHRGARHRRRHRGDRRRLPGAVRDRATRWSCSSRPTTATRRRSPWPGPRRVFVTLRPPDYRLDVDALRGRGHAPHPAAAAQLAAQPHRQGAHARRAGGDRRGRLRARPGRGHRRGLRAPGLRRRATCRSPRCRACASARSPSRRAARRSPSPGGRSAGSAARPSWSRRSRRPSSSSPT